VPALQADDARTGASQHTALPTAA